MKVETKHTPTPWEYMGDTTAFNEAIIRYANSVHVCHVTTDCSRFEDETIEIEEDERDANATFIVRACNAHDQLVEALKAARTRLQNCYSIFNDQNFTDRHGDADLTKRCLDKINAALAAAEGGAK